MDSRRRQLVRPIALAASIALGVGLSATSGVAAQGSMPSTWSAGRIAPMVAAPTSAYGVIASIAVPGGATGVRGLTTLDDTVFVSTRVTDEMLSLDARINTWVGAGIPLEGVTYALAASDDSLFMARNDWLGAVPVGQTSGVVDDTFAPDVTWSPPVTSAYALAADRAAGTVFWPLATSTNFPSVGKVSGDLLPQSITWAQYMNRSRVYDIALADDSLYIPLYGPSFSAADDSIAVYRSSAMSPFPTVIPVGLDRPVGVAVTSSDRVYIVGEASPTIAVVDGLTGAPLPSIAMPSHLTNLGDEMGVTTSRDDTVFVSAIYENYDRTQILVINPGSTQIDDSVLLPYDAVNGSYANAYAVDASDNGVLYAGMESDPNVYAVAPVSGVLSSASGAAGDARSVSFAAPSDVPFDDSAVQSLSWNGSPLTSVVRSGKTYSFTVPAGSGTVDVTAALNGGNTISLGSFTYGSPTPPTPDPVYPPGAPSDVVGVASSRAVTVSWAAPASQGSFPVSMYKVSASPGGASCLSTAPTTSCTVTGLTDGTAYTFSVVALNGAGWGPAGTSRPVTPGGVTPAPEPQPLPYPLVPGDSSLIVNGVPDPNVKVDPKPTDRGLTITGPDFEMDLDGLDGRGNPLNLGPDGVLILNQERNVQTSGKGFLRNSDVDLYVDPPVVAGPTSRSSRAASAIYVGTVRTTASGTFAGLATLPDSIKAGQHVLQAVGRTPEGQPRAMSLGVMVTQSLVLDQGSRKPAGRHDRMRTTGSSTGIDDGVKLTPYIKYSGQSTFSQGRASIVVRADGTFTWTRQIRKGKTLTAYVAYTDVKSNDVVWLKLT